jgi:hypothetical protein
LFFSVPSNICHKNGDDFVSWSLMNFFCLLINDLFKKRIPCC